MKYAVMSNSSSHLRCYMWSWICLHIAVENLKTNNSAKYWPPKPRVCDLNCLYHIKIWMICRQQCCRDDHRISKKPRTTSDACLSLPLALEIYWDITVTPFLSVNRNPGLYCWLTHWGRVTHICVSQLTIIGWDNGLSRGRHQAIIWTNDEIMLIGPLGTNISEILSEIHTFSFKEMHFKTSSAKWRPSRHPGIHHICPSHVMVQSPIYAMIISPTIACCSWLPPISRLLRYVISLPHKLKYRSISFPSHAYLKNPIVLKFCTGCGNIAAVLCAKFQKDCATDNYW